MKFRNLLIAGILGVLAASAAKAQTPIYISGAPAGRAYFSQAIYDALGGSANTSITYTYSSSSLTTVNSSNAFQYSNALIFFGGTLNGTAVTVYVSYPGSSAGIQDVSAPGEIVAPFLASTDTVAGTPAGGYPDPTSVTNPASYVNGQKPDFTASDEFQGSTPWEGTNNLTGSTVTYTTLDSDVVGVIPYRWVASPDAPSSLTNITPQQAQVLFTSGWVYLSQLTGQASDSTTAIYAIGRDIGSGLRTVTYAETGIGGSLATVNQFEPSVVTVNGTNIATYQQLYPAETVNGVPLALGEGGYSSFSKILPAITAYTISKTAAVSGSSIVTGTSQNYAGATKAIYVTALDDADAVNVVANYGAHELSYNGFYANGTPGAALSTNGSGSNAINNGQYTFWSYLQLQYLDSLKTSKVIAYNFEQQVDTELTTKDSPVLLNSLKVSRQTDGGNISLGGSPP